MERNREMESKVLRPQFAYKAILPGLQTFDRRTDAKIWIQQTEADLRKGKHVAIFARSDGLKPIEIRKKWEKAVEDAGIKDFNFHDLRHTCASYLAMNGATLSEISAILGHKTLQMVKRYSHLTEQHSTEVIKRMTSKIFADL